MRVVGIVSREKEERKFIKKDNCDCGDGN